MRTTWDGSEASVSEAPRDHPMRALGARINEARMRRGWTYAEFAKETGESSSSLNYLVNERTRPIDYHKLRGLVATLGERWDQEWDDLWRATTRDVPTGTTRDRAVSAPAATIPAAGRGADPVLSLLSQCLVRVEAGEGLRSTGFFVAPGEALTWCARTPQRGTLDVAWEGGSSAAAWRPLGGGVLLLRLAAPPASHGC